MQVEMPRHSVKKNIDVDSLYARFNTRGMTKKASSVSQLTHKQSDPLSANMLFDRYGIGQQFEGLNSPNNDEFRKYLQSLCRVYYDTHPIIGSMIDVYSSLPIQGMDIRSKDTQHEEFYKNIFFDQMNYQTVMREIGQEFFTIGECFTMSTFDESLGIYTDEYVVSPDIINVVPVPLTNDVVYTMTPSEEMRRLVSTKQPKEAYDMFMKTYADIVPLIMRGEDIPMPASQVDHIMRKASPGDYRGTPLAKRALRWLMYEERLDAAMKSIADRLYAPLTMFKLGIPSVGDNKPLLPSPENIEEFRRELDAALNADFRSIITHIGVDAKEILSGKSISGLNGDRSMIDERIYMAFGLSSDIFKPSANSSYASSAIRMELAAQTMSMYQNQLVDHFKRRAAYIAEVNEFYDYEIVGGVKKDIVDTIQQYNEETKEIEVVEKKRLLIPDLSFKSVNFRDEKAQRDFLKEMRSLGIPIPDSEMLVGVDIDFEDTLIKKKEEDIAKAVKEAETVKAIAIATSEQDLPIPSDTVKKMVEGQLPPELKDLLPDKAEQFDIILDNDETISEDDSTTEDINDEITGEGNRPNISDNAKSDMPKQTD